MHWVDFHFSVSQLHLQYERHIALRYEVTTHKIKLQLLEIVAIVTVQIAIMRN